MNISIEKCPAYHDHRGDLIQFVTERILQHNALPFGQVYLLTFNGTGVIRGNHYHYHSSEMFCLISGSVEMVFEDIATKERVTKNFTSDDNEFFRITVRERIAHSIKSISEFAVMVSYSSREFDLSEEDKIPYPLI